MNIEQINPDKDKPYLIYTNYSACKGCGGMCCKLNAGAYIPDDFKYPITPCLIIHLLLTKKYTIDSIGDDGHDRVYFIRPRHLDEDPLKPELMGGVCINWSAEKGCSLKEKERPYQCRTLIPLFDKYQCRYKPSDKATKHEIAGLWTPYQEMFQLAIQNFKQIHDSLIYMYAPDELGNTSLHENINDKLNAIREVLQQL